MADAADVASVWPVAQALKSLGVEFHVGGSVASNVYGVYRATADTDLVAALRPEHVGPLTARLQEAYYVDAQMVRDAIARRGSFNVIHFDTAQKVDIFIAKQTPFDLEARRRAVERPISEDGRFFLPIASAEDVVLSKLVWFQLGGGTSDRQWGDVLGVLRVQEDALDQRYMEKWAAELGVSDELQWAWEEAGGD